MYLLDTNVLSELRPMRARKPHPGVAAWFGSVPVGSLYLSSITIFELELGALQAERRDPPKGAALRTWIEDYVVPTFTERVIPVDLVVARRCAALHLPITRSERDAFIAATALVHNMTAVTRNTADFSSTGVATLDPWTN
jgi:predicted nucleic acid-binding protein